MSEVLNEGVSDTNDNISNVSIGEIDMDKNRTSESNADNKNEENKKHEPREGSKRWNEIYYKSKELERLQPRLVELEEELKVLSEHNRNLEKSLNKVSGRLSMEDIPTKLSELKAEKMKAIEAEDWKKVYILSSQIEDLRDALILDNKSNVSYEISEALEKQEADRQVKDFINNNKWLSPENPEYDEVLSEAAIAMDLKLLQSGFKGTTKQRLETVKSKLEERFGKDIFTKVNNNNSNVSPNVMSASGKTNAPNTGQITLSDVERRVALGIYPNDPKAEEKYLKQKILIMKERGGL